MEEINYDEYTDFMDAARENSGSDFLNSIFNPSYRRDMQMAQNLVLNRELANLDYNNKAKFFNEYQSPSAVVQQYKDANLNINGILGHGALGGAPSSPSVSGSSVTEPGNPLLDQINSTVDTIGAASLIPSQVGLNKENAFLARKQAENVDNLAQSTIFRNWAESVNFFASAGLSNATAIGLATDNKYKDTEHIAELFIKLQNYENMQQEYKLMEDEHDKKLKEIDLIDEEIKVAETQQDLNTAQALKARKEAMVAEETARYQKITNEFFEKHGYDPNSPIDVSIRNGVVTGHNDEVNLIEENMSNWVYTQSFAQNNGAVNAEWNKPPESIPSAIFKGIYMISMKGDQVHTDICNAMADWFKSTGKSISDSKETRSAYRAYIQSLRSEAWQAHKDAVSKTNDIETLKSLNANYMKVLDAIDDISYRDFKATLDKSTKSNKPN